MIFKRSSGYINLQIGNSANNGVQYMNTEQIIRILKFEKLISS